MNKLIETYTFSRALHMMRNGGKKMAYIKWGTDRFLQVINGEIVDAFLDSVYNIYTLELMGEWVEVNEKS